jgi:hypothetical protein
VVAKTAGKKKSTSVAQVIEMPVKGKTADEYESLIELLDELMTPGLDLERVKISPEQAKVFVKFNSPNQRYGPNTSRDKKVGQRVLDYRRDMVNGDWNDENRDPVYVDEDGFMFNSYHRMAALAGLANTHPQLSFHFVVARNVPASTIEVIDRGLARNLTQTLRIKGIDASSLEKSISKSIIWRLGDCGATEAMTEAQQIAVFQKYEKAIRFASILYNSHKHSVKLSTVRGAIARAYASLGAEDNFDIQEQLIEFMHCLDTSTSEKDRGIYAIRLRNDAQAFSLRHRSTSREARDILYAKSLNAIKLFLKNVPSDKTQYLVQAKTQPFPLPEDKIPVSLIGTNLTGEGA